MSAEATDRLARYRRLLPRLVLGRALYTRGAVTLSCSEPFDTLCDVTLRLVDAAGMTHAERSVTLGPDSEPVGLGTTVNLAPGLYHVVATPPLQQFWSAVPVEHRMALTVAPRLARDEDDPAALAATLRAHGDTGGSREAWLSIIGDASPAGGCAILDLVRRVVQADMRPDQAVLAEAWPGIATVGGIDVTAPDLHARLVALLALAATQAGDIADWAAALVDAHAFALALGSVEGVPVAWPPAETAAVDRDAALSWFLWGRGVADVGAAVVRALALSGYVPPPVLADIARDGTAQEVFLAPSHATGLTLWRRGSLAVASRGGAWMAALGSDLRILGTGALRTRRDGALVEALHDGDAAVTVPLWGLEDVRLEPGLLTGRHADVGFALASTVPLRRDPERPETRLFAEGPVRVACAVGEIADGLAAAARDRLNRPWPEAHAPWPTGNAIESVFCRAPAHAQDLTIRVGETVLSLDLSEPRTQADGASP
ncbi:hypothetical protein [uncultured Alsobacter sp.]|uniref:hypothetical protein n=1 Tax=uncultured Alsobacter sp. TaxID=1748258 RepID=UPI0025DFA5E3|nr:hypothetical protein [uncultured Alsobacter sp.]